MEGARVVEDVACTICGCVCDDLKLSIEGGRITKAERACALAEPWFLGQESAQPPAAMLEGAPATLEAGLDRAAKIFRAARAPLIFGLSRSSTEGQRASVALADRIGATIDTTASLCHAPSIVALQQVGESTSSLGEIKNRADLVIFWGCDPTETHPRHLERYSVEPAGELVAGRSDRTVVVADALRTATAELADVYLPIEPGRDFEALWTLRALIRGMPPRHPEDCGAPLPRLVELAERMKSCRCGVFFFGLGLSTAGLGHLNVTALLALVRDLHRFTRFHARRMRMMGDVAGADSVLIWQTGFPFSVNLARGYPRYNPGEFSAQELLERGEVDACLLVGSECVPLFSPAARDALTRIPTIVLDYPTVASAIEPTVRFTTAVYGIHRRGTAYRMDEIPIPLKAVLPSHYPSDDEVLAAIQARLNLDDSAPVA